MQVCELVVTVVRAAETQVNAPKKGCLSVDDHNLVVVRPQQAAVANHMDVRAQRVQDALRIPVHA